ncbi:MAG: aminotransferase class, partial [Bacillota bacterium]|nr:aminotransferase class [Bacillota bacterium]
RVWTKDELTKLGDICLKYKVTVVSDEIHGDFTYDGYTHHVFANIKPEFSKIAVTCTAPSKTFNIAGLQVSNIFIEDTALRKAFINEYNKSGYSQLNSLGLVACQAAYEHGREWLDELKIYLKSNLDYARSFFAERLPQIKLIEPQGTYLIWLDCSDLGLSDEELNDIIINKAKLWLDSGTMFGKDGEGFQRINIACPRETLKRALEQLENAVKNI